MLQSVKQKIYDALYAVGVEVKLVRKPNYKWLQEQNIQAVLDIGANTGQFAAFIAGVLPKAKVYSFEPLAGCYQQLRENTHNLPVQAFHYALGEQEEKLKINVSKHSPSSSLLELNPLHTEVFPGTDYQGTEEITVKRLDDVAPALGLAGNYLVKIDVQGFEDKVIKGGQQTIGNAAVLIIETSFQHLYEGQLLFNGIYELLAGLGFEFRGNMSQTRNPRDGSFIYAESIFYHRRLRKG